MSNRSARLCLFTDSRVPSGMGEHVLTLAGELAHDYRVCIAAPARRGGGELLRRAKTAGLGAVPLRGRTEAARCESLRSWLRTVKVDIFHVHAGISWEGCGGTLAAREVGVPVVLRTEHQTYRPCAAAQREAHRRVVPAVDRIVCVSAAVAHSFLTQGVPVELLTVVPNGVRPPEPTSRSIPDVLARLALPPQARVLLSVGRLHIQKGHRDLLAAVPLVLRREPDVHFVWVGTGPQERRLREAIERQGLAGRVHLVGRRRDVPDLLASAYALVLPSLFEGLPLVALEAMAVGLAVIGTAVPGTREAVQDGVTGRLVPPRDPAALAAALVELLSDPGTAARWGAAARRRYQECFTAARMAQRTATVYQELLAGDAASRPEARSAQSSGVVRLAAGPGA